MKNLQTTIIINIGVIGILLISLLTLSPAWSSAQHPGDDSNEDEMPDWTENVSIGDHYIIIKQDKTHPNQVTVEELMWFKNEGSENFTGHIFLWSQPNNILTKINKFGSVINNNYNAAKVYPSSYSPNFVFSNLSSENLTIGPSESLEMVFNYTLTFSNIENAEFHKTFLYDNSNIVLFIELNDNLKAEGKENIEIIFNETSGKYITPHSADSSKVLGEFITISFLESDSQSDNNGKDGNNKDGEETDYIMYYLIAILVIAAVLTVLLQMKKAKKK